MSSITYIVCSYQPSTIKLHSQTSNEAEAQYGKENFYSLSKGDKNRLPKLVPQELLTDVWHRKGFSGG